MFFLPAPPLICVEISTCFSDLFFKPSHRLRGHQQEHFDKLVTGEILDREDFTNISKINVIR